MEILPYIKGASEREELLKELEAHFKAEKLHKRMEFFNKNLDFLQKLNGNLLPKPILKTESTIT